MRHFRSILYAIVLAPAVWVLVAVGLTHDLTARGRDGFAVESLTGLVLLLLGGAAYGILIFAPISPLGPVVAGVVFLVAGAWAIESPSGYAELWPSGVVKDGFDLSRPGYGLAALLAVPLILTVLSVRRWSGFEPVVLPIIGPVGRARGAAPVAGTPVAALQTAVLPVSPTDALRADGADERTTLIRMPGTDAVPEATTVLTRPTEDDGDSTTVLRLPVVANEPATEDVAAGDEEPTDAMADERPTTDVLDEPPTEDAAAGNDEPTEAVTHSNDEPTEAVAVSHDEPAEAVTHGNDEPTEAVTAGNDEPTEAVVEEPATEDVIGSAGEAPTVSLDDEATEPSRAVEPAIDESEAVAAEASDGATEASPAAEEEKTAVSVPPTDANDEATAVVESAETSPAGVDEPVGSLEAADGLAEAEPAEPETVQPEPAEAEAAEAEGADVPAAQPEVVSAEESGAAVAVPEAADHEDADDEPVTSVLTLAEEQEPVAGDEPVTSVPARGESEALASGEEVGDESAPADSPTADVDQPAGDEATVGELVANGLAPVEPEDSASDRVSASAAVSDDARADVVDDDDVVDGEEVLVEETTYLLMPDDDDARTQAIRLRAELEADGERTQVIRPVGYEPGQTTRDLGAPGERTQVIRPSAHRVPGETTQVIGLPGEKTRRIVRSGEKVAGLDETQLIRRPDPSDDGTRTQVIRLGQVTPPSDDAELTLAMPHVETAPPGEPGLVTPPAGGGEPVRLPRQRVDSDQLPDQSDEPTEPEAPPSIARAESPNFAEDPTGRIVSPILPPDEPTRTMTVMNIERPPEDSPEIPAQRTPPAED